MRIKAIFIIKVILISIALSIVWFYWLKDDYVRFLIKNILTPLHGYKKLGYPVSMGINNFIPFISLVVALDGVRLRKRAVVLGVGCLILMASHCAFIEVMRLAYQAYAMDPDGGGMWPSLLGNLGGALMFFLPLILFFLPFHSNIVHGGAKSGLG